LSHSSNSIPMSSEKKDPAKGLVLFMALQNA